MFSKSILIALVVTFAVTDAAVPAINGFKTTWSEDFNGNANALPDDKNWIFSTGTSYPGGAANWGTGEIQTYTKNVANVKLSGNGALQITAIKDQAGKWTSARIETQRKDFLCQPGGKMRIQASIALPNLPAAQAIGYWPAFWTLGAAFRGNYKNWPAIGEFDIMEAVNGVNTLHGTLHCGTASGGPCKETTGLGSTTGGLNWGGKFNTYTFEVDRSGSVEALRWYLNGKQYKQITSKDLDTATFNQVAHNPHFILLNLAMGGAFPDGVYKKTTPVAATKSDGVLQVEYVAVYNTATNGKRSSLHERRVEGQEIEEAEEE